MDKLEISGDICLKNQCHHCCIETEMLVLKTECTQISKATGIPITNFSFMTEDNQRMLKNKTIDDQEVCFFLDDKGLCSIYQFRPEGCTYYPIIWDLITHQAVSDDYCPFHTELANKIERISLNLELFILKLYGWL